MLYCKTLVVVQLQLTSQNLQVVRLTARHLLHKLLVVQKQAITQLVVVAVLHLLLAVHKLVVRLVLLVKLHQQPVLHQGLPIQVRASVGISLYPRDGHDVRSLLADADAAMYRAKQNGRISRPAA